jgi:hypothetical protein
MKPVELEFWHLPRNIENSLVFPLSPACTLQIKYYRGCNVELVDSNQVVLVLQSCAHELLCAPFPFAL